MTSRVLILLTLLTAPAWAGPKPPKPHEVAAEVDALLADAWEAEGIRPAKDSGDAEFLRRASLDLQGVVPPPELVEAFLAAKGDDRRGLVVRGLLFGQGYARGMAERWANELIGRSEVIQAGGPRAPLVLWLARQLASNTSWDVVVRELLTAEGPIDDNGATTYFVRYDRRPEEIAGNAVRVFQGLSIQCAQCHDHPFTESITQQDFWGVAAYFARVRQQTEGEVRSLVETPRGQVRLPGLPGQKRPVVAPRYLDLGEPLSPSANVHRREALARELTRPENPYFAPATVNRVWSFFFGRGFADLDDLLTSDTTLPDVLDRLARDFRESGYDMRRLCQVITSTKAYALTSHGKPSEQSRAQQALFARAPLRALTPEQLWASLSQVIDLERIPYGETADQAAMWRDRLRRQFFATFAPEGQRSLDQNTIPQALSLINGALTNELLAPAKNQFIKELLQRDGDAAKIHALYLRVVGRPATRGELRALKLDDMSSEEQLVFLQDVLWALINSSEFSFNH